MQLTKWVYLKDEDKNKWISSNSRHDGETMFWAVSMEIQRRLFQKKHL